MDGCAMLPSRRLGGSALRQSVDIQGLSAQVGGGRSRRQYVNELAMQ